MKKLYLAAALLAALCTLAACGSQTDANTAGETVELRIFAAASMTETMDQVIE